MRVSLQPAFVLHQRSYRETSLIVDLFTRDYGRVAVVAKGVRTPRSKMRALLQAFVPLLVTFQGRGELMSLVSAETYAAPFQLRKNGLFAGFYINELLMRVLPKHDAHPALYANYREVLAELQSDVLQQKTLRLFEKQLLKEMGYELHLDYAMPDKKPFVVDKFYYFDTELGFQACLESAAMQQRVFTGKSLIALAREELDDADVMQQVKRLMRIALAPLLGSLPLQSRKLFLEVEPS